MCSCPGAALVPMPSLPEAGPLLCPVFCPGCWAPLRTTSSSPFTDLCAVPDTKSTGKARAQLLSSPLSPSTQLGPGGGGDVRCCTGTGPPWGLQGCAHCCLEACRVQGIQLEWSHALHPLYPWPQCGVESPGLPSVAAPVSPCDGLVPSGEKSVQNKEAACTCFSLDVRVRHSGPGWFCE